MANEAKGNLDVYNANKAKIPNLLFLIERSKNKNIVLFEALMKARCTPCLHLINISLIVMIASGQQIQRRQAGGCVLAGCGSGIRSQGAQGGQDGRSQRVEHD